MRHATLLSLLALTLSLAACQDDDAAARSGPAGPSGLALSGCTAAPADLVSWWPGNDHPNDIESHNHGSLQGGAGFAAGKVGQAFNLDGSDDYVLIGNPANLKMTTGLTIDAWVRPTASRSNGELVGVLTKWSQDFSLSPTADSYSLWLRSVGTDYEIFTGVHTSDGNEPIIVGGVITLNTWAHVAMTYNASTGVLVAYVNGVAVSNFDGASLSIHPTDAQIAIGRELSGQSRHFPGQIDEVEIFDRALSGAQIAAIYNAGPAGKCKPQCQGRAQTTTGTINGGQIDLTEGDDVWVGTGADETVYGYGGEDRMCGKGGADELHGGDDADRLQGDEGRDQLFGEGENDKLYGNANNDHLDGGAGSDKCSGGGGTNTKVDCES